MDKEHSSYRGYISPQSLSSADAEGGMQGVRPPRTGDGAWVIGGVKACLWQLSSCGVNLRRDLLVINYIIDINILFVIGPRFELVGGVCMPGDVGCYAETK